MQAAALTLEDRPLRPGRRGQGPAALGGCPPGLPVEPDAEYVDVVERSDGVLKLLPGRARPRVPTPHHVVHLGGVAQATDPDPQRMERLGIVAVADLGQPPQEHRALPLPHVAGPLEDPGRVSGAPGPDPAKILAKAVDVQVEDAVGQVADGYL